MYPDNPQGQPDNPAVPTALPGGVSQNPQSPQASVSSGAVPVAPANLLMQVRRVLTGYGNDPYQLCENFGKLKSAYLSDQYHISVNKVENQ